MGVSAPFIQPLEGNLTADVTPYSVHVFGEGNKYTALDLDYLSTFDDENFYGEEILTPFEWMEPVYEHAFQEDNAEVIADMCSHVEDYMASGNIYLCDLLLGKVDYDRLSPEVIVSMLRFMFPVKNSLENWGSAVSLASGKISEAGYNPDVVLRGLV